MCTFSPEDTLCVAKSISVSVGYVIALKKVMNNIFMELNSDIDALCLVERPNGHVSPCTAHYPDTMSSHDNLVPLGSIDPLAQSH